MIVQNMPLPEEEAPMTYEEAWDELIQLEQAYSHCQERRTYLALSLALSLIGDQMSWVELEDRDEQVLQHDAKFEEAA